MSDWPVNDWDVQWPLPAAIVTRRPNAPVIITIWRGGPLDNGSEEGASGSAAQTIAPVIQSARGASVARANAVQVVGGVSQAATGSPVALGQAGQSIAPVSQAAQGAAVASGVASQAAAAMTQAAAGSPVARGAATQTVAAVSQSAAGSAAAKGSAAQLVATVTQSASGSSGNPLRGGWDTSALDAPVMAFSNDNRTVIGHDPTGGSHNNVYSLASATTGKLFASVSIDNAEYGAVSVTDGTDSQYVYFAWDGQIYSSATGQITYLAGYSAPCAVDVAFDLDAHLVWFRVNGGNWNGSSGNDPETGVGGYALPVSALPYHVKASLPYFYDSQRTLNTGSAAFTYAPPAGFVALAA